MLRYLTELQKVKEYEQKFLGNEFIVKEYGTWVITDPVKGGLVDRGADAQGFSYGFSQAGKFITGNHYDTPVILRREHKNALYPKYNVFVPLPTIQTGWKKLSKLILPLLTKYEICAFELIRTGNPCIEFADIFKDDNMHMILSLASTGKSWDHRDVTRNAIAARMPHFDLVYSILHNETPLIAKSEY
jgi:hypothetical protein